MFCYIDESGHTGLHIFDKTQPVQLYGLLISPVDLNNLISPQVQIMRDKLNISYLHARLIGDRLESISEDLFDLINNFELSFKIFTVNKLDNIIFQFFDLVFDNEINPVVPSMWYCSPFRYKLLIAISYFLFNEEIKELAWQFFNKKEFSARSAFIQTCKKLSNRVHKLPLPSYIQCKVFLILKSAIKNYNVIKNYCRNTANFDANLVCFRSVIEGIMKTGSQPIEIVIDQELDYNSNQQDALNLYRELQSYPFPNYPGIPFMKLNNIPDANFKFSSSKSNLGLEITDILLWICKRKIEGRKLSDKLERLVDSSNFVWANDISLTSLTKKWLI
ncbi:DUF3800 domain-containing protein [Legionella sainthelensi]|uniref:DUF3800 domain-containing protein n=1 Tax=Legionella sainthelensi TaxID=28087 RepID=UPI000E20B9E2|nr:DUF3800 domain-containing protein [Legionella sainthelensi]